MDREINRKAVRHTYIHTNGQMGKQTDRKRERDRQNINMNLVIFFASKAQS
jgi:hypothetical protein